MTKNLLLLSVLLSLLLTIYAANGVRGTDQYTYLADVEMLASGGSPEGNLHFPAKIIREGDAPSPNYFAHNSPLLYISAALSKHLGAYRAWITINVASHWLLALSLFLIVTKLTSRELALTISAFYLVSPIAIWQTANILQETFFSAVMALALLGMYFHNTTMGKVVLLLALAIGVCCHPIFLAPAFLYPFYLFFTAYKHRQLSSAVYAILALGLMAYLKNNASIWMPSQFQPNLQAIITSAIPGKSNMFWHYSVEQISITPELMLEKLSSAAQKHFLSLSNAPFFLFTNLAVIATVYLLFLRRMSVFIKALAPMFILGLYAGIIVLQQNHARYQQIVAAASFVLIALALHELHSQLTKVKKGLLLLVFICITAVSALLAHSLRVDSQHEAQQLALLRSQLPERSNDDKIVAYDLKPHSPLAYLLRPNKVLSIRSDMLDQATSTIAVEQFAPQIVLLPASTTPQENSQAPAFILENDFFKPIAWHELDGTGKIPNTYSNADTTQP